MRPRSFLFPVLLVIFALLSTLTLRGISTSFAINQLLFFLVSIFVYFVVSSLPFSWFERSRWIWYGAILALLGLTLLIGRVTNGSQAWISLGTYRLQASELLKPILFVFLASEFAQKNIRKPKNLFFFAILALIPVALVMLQPDLGTTVIVLAGTSFVFLSLQPSKKIVASGVVAAFAIGIFAWLFFLKPYQKDRIQNFFNPQTDIQGSGYNARQALIAVGSGGIWGQGWGQGGQSQLRFLPERQTDFLFATYAEEKGWVGSIFLAALYILLFIQFYRIIQTTEHQTQVNALLGLAVAFWVQTFINIGMNIGLTPVTGVPLPLFSLGGSSLLASCLILGMFESVRRGQKSSLRRLE